jgi:hypothetical protein
MDHPCAIRPLSAFHSILLNTPAWVQGKKRMKAGKVCAKSSNEKYGSKPQKNVRSQSHAHYQCIHRLDINKLR